MSMVPRERDNRERREPRQDQWSGGKSAAALATVSGEPLVHPLPFPGSRSLNPKGFGKTGPEALTREPGDLPSSREPILWARCTRGRRRS